MVIPNKIRTFLNNMEKLKKDPFQYFPNYFNKSGY